MAIKCRIAEFLLHLHHVSKKIICQARPDRFAHQNWHMNVKVVQGAVFELGPMSHFVTPMAAFT